MNTSLEDFEQENLEVEQLLIPRLNKSSSRSSSKSSSKPSFSSSLFSSSFSFSFSFIVLVFLLYFTFITCSCSKPSLPTVDVDVDVSIAIEIEESELQAISLFGQGKTNDGLEEISRMVSIASHSPPVLAKASILSLFYGDREAAVSYLESCTSKGACGEISKEAGEIISRFNELENQIRNDDESSQDYKLLADEADQVSMLANQFFISQYKESQVLQDIFLSDYEAISRSDLIFDARDVGCKLERKIAENKQGFIQICEDAADMEVNKPTLALPDESMGKCLEGCLYRGEAYLARGELIMAQSMFNRVLESSMNTNEEALNLSHQVDEYGRLNEQKVQIKKAASDDKLNYYKVLGVDKNADHRSIKQAYRKKVLAVHPDKGGSEEEMTKVAEAWNVLNNDSLKTLFDEEVASRSSWFKMLLELLW